MSFGSAFSTGGASNATPATGGLFGNTSNTGGTAATSTGTGTFGGTGGGLFGNFGAKPATGGSIFGGGGASTTPATGNLFSNFGGGGAASANTNPGAGAGAGSSSAPASAAPTPGLGLFGVKPSEQNTNAGGASGASTTPQPAAGGLFGLGGNNANASAGASQPASATTPASTSFFTNTPKPADGNGPTTVPAPAFGANFFKKPDAPTSSSAPATATTPAAPSLFGGFGAKSADDASKDKGATPAVPSGNMFGQPPVNKDASAAAPSPFGLFGQKPAEQKDASGAVAKDGEKKEGVAGLPSFGAPINKDTSTGGSTAAPSISVPPPSMLRGKTIEEIVNKWSSDLEIHVREFNRLAGEVAVWDRALIDNGNTIAALFQHVLLAEQEQSDVEQSLKHVEDQQKELAATLDVYEKSAGELFDGQGGGLRALDVGPADAERDKHYTLAADLNANLDDLSRSLMQMIESVNGLSESDQAPDGVDGSTKGDAPLEQIAQILSSHLESLQWIDNAVREVDTKITDVESRMREASAGDSVASSVSGGINGSTPRPRGFGLR